MTPEQIAENVKRLRELYHPAFSHAVDDFMQTINALVELVERGGWRSIKANPPPNGECMIWLKPHNGSGNANWSVRNGSFWNGTFREWGRHDDYKPEVYSRITHWRPFPDAPPLSEIEGDL